MRRYPPRRGRREQKRQEKDLSLRTHLHRTDTNRTASSTDFPSEVSRSVGKAVKPSSELIQHVSDALRILSTCPRRHMKVMIGIRKQLQRCPPAELFAKRFKLIERRQCVAGPLQEQHRDLYVKQMFGAILRRATGRVKRKSEECQ